MSLLTIKTHPPNYNSTKTKCIFFAQFYGTNDETYDPLVQLITVDKYGHEGDMQCCPCYLGVCTHQKQRV